MKVAGDAGAGEALSTEEKGRTGALATSLALTLLSRVWQMLLKGIEEAGRAPNPLAAAEMVLIRICHTADLPTPDEIIRTLGGTIPVNRGGAGGVTPAVPDRRGPLNSANAPERLTPPPGPAEAGPRSFVEMVELAGLKRDARLKLHLEDHVSLLKFEPGRIEVSLLNGAPPGLVGELGEKLSKWTNSRWIVSVGKGRGERPIGEIRREAEAADLAAAKSHPAVSALLAVFPEAEVKGVRRVRKT